MRITIEIAAATAGFETDIKRASREADKALKDIEKQARIMGAAVATGLAAAAAAAVALTKRSIDAADALAKMSQKVGVSVERLAGLQHAANLSGVSVQQLQTGLVQLARRAAEAAGGMGESVRAFEAVGISTTDANGKLKSTEQLLAEIATKFAGYEDGAAKSALATQLFGKAGATLIPLLNQGADGLAAMQAEAEALGLVISTDTAKAAEQFNDNITRLTKGLDALGNDIATELLPSLVDLTNQAVEWTRQIREDGSLREWVDTIQDAAKWVDELAIFVGTKLAAGAMLSLGAQLVAVTTAMYRAAAAGKALNIVLAANPIGLITTLVAAAAAGIYYLSTQEDEAARATADLTRATDLLATAQGSGLQPAIESARLARENAKAALEDAEAQLKRAEAFLEVARVRAQADASIREGVGAGQGTGGQLFQQTQARVNQLRSSLGGLQSSLEESAEGLAEAEKRAAAWEQKLRELGGTAGRTSAPIVQTGSAAKKAGDEFAKLADITDKLARDLAGPIERAWIDYEDQIRSIAEAGAKAIEAGEDIGDVQDEVAKAVSLATAQWEKHREEIRKQFDPLERLNRLIDQELARSVDGTAAVMTQMAVALEEATRQYGPHSDEVKEAKQRYDDFANSVAAAGDSLDEIREKAIDTATNALQQTLGDAFAGLTDLGPWEALGQAVARNMGTIASSIRTVIDANTDAVTGVTDWGAAMNDLGETAEEVLPQIAQFVGATIGGGGEGAQTGAAIGAAIGLIWGPIGSAIGSILGGFIGGTFDDDPSVQVAGAFGTISGSVEQTRDSAFGTFRVRTDEVEQPTSRQFADAILEFDNLIASFLTDEQIEHVAAQLRAFDLTLEKGAVQIGLVLQERFDAILAALPEQIAGFVDSFSTDLQARVQALADVLALQGLEDSGNLITDSLGQALQMVSEFGRAGETVAQTYGRLVEVTLGLTDVLQVMGTAAEYSKDQIATMAAELGEAAGSTERATALLEDFYETFYTELERLTAQLEAARAAAGGEFADIGLDAADFMGDGGAQAFRELLEENWPALSAEARVQWLEAANALGLVIELTEDYSEALAEAAENGEEVIDHFEDLAELLRTVEDQIAALEPPPSVEERIAEVNTQIEELIAKAVEFGATEEEVARIRYLGQLRLNALLDEQAEAADAAEEAMRSQVQAATNLADYMAVLNAEATDGVSPLTSALRQLRGEYERHIERINELAIASGRSGASVGELGAAQRWYQAQVQRLIADLLEQASGLVAQFYGQTASGSIGSGLVSTEIGGISQVTDAVEDRYARELALLEDLQRFIDDLLLSDLSPLTPDQRLAEAQAQYEALLAAAQGGDLDALAQLQAAAQAYLGEAQSFYGGVGPYDTIFATVLEQLGALTGAGPQNQPLEPTEPTAIFGGPVTVEPGAGFEALSELDRELLALELVEVLRDLIVATNSSLLEVADQLGLDLLDLVEALGISLEDLTIETTMQLADLSRALGIDLVDLATSVGVDLGNLADAQSLLNDALEQTIDSLPTGIRERLRQLLADVENAVTEADANAAIGELEAAVLDLPPDLQALLAPFLGGVVTPGDELLAQAIAQTTELSAININAGLQLESLVRIEGLLVSMGAIATPGTGDGSAPFTPWNPGDPGPGVGPIGSITAPSAITEGVPAANDQTVVSMQTAMSRMAQQLEDIADTNRRLLQRASDPLPGGRRNVG